MKSIKIILTVIIAISLTSCFIGAGTHGSIKNYNYATTKDKLENAVNTVIKNNPNIHCDTTINKISIKDINSGKSDTIIDNYYNDGKTYVTIKIKVADLENEYTFRYYGDEEYWKTSLTSGIFICYAYDKNGQGGSEGTGGVEWYKWGLRKKLTDLFEKEFVTKIDNELKIAHTETE